MITASWRSIRRVLARLAILAWPAAGYAQHAIVAGTVTDSSGGVLPGVTITVVHEETGNTFEGVTDARQRGPGVPAAHDAAWRQVHLLGISPGHAR